MFFEKDQFLVINGGNHGGICEIRYPAETNAKLFRVFFSFFCDGRVGDGTKINNMILVFGWFLNSLCLGRNILLNIGPSAGCFQMSFSAVLRES